MSYLPQKQTAKGLHVQATLERCRRRDFGLLPSPSNLYLDNTRIKKGKTHISDAGLDDVSSVKSFRAGNIHSGPYSRLKAILHSLSANNLLTNRVKVKSLVSPNDPLLIRLMIAAIDSIHKHNRHPGWVSMQIVENGKWEEKKNWQLSPHAGNFSCNTQTKGNLRRVPQASCYWGPSNDAGTWNYVYRSVSMLLPNGVGSGAIGRNMPHLGRRTCSMYV